MTINERTANAISSDSMIRLFGIEVEETSDSLTRVSAEVKEDCLQLHDLAHGAFIFALMDVAFALTVNADRDAVAVQWSLSQFRSARLGDRVTAECRLLHMGQHLAARAHGHELHDYQPPAHVQQPALRRYPIPQPCGAELT
jgi:uncharacterized protein (TIGR00369 family)